MEARPASGIKDCWKPPCIGRRPAIMQILSRKPPRSGRACRRIMPSSMATSERLLPPCILFLPSTACDSQRTPKRPTFLSPTFTSHGFKSREAKRFELRRKQKKVGGGELFVDSVLFAKKEDVFLEAALANDVFGGAAVRAIADEDELRGHFGADNGENLHGVGKALDRAEIGEVHEDGFAIGSPLRGKPLVGSAIVEIAVHEIGNDFDGTLDFEFLESLA